MIIWSYRSIIDVYLQNEQICEPKNINFKDEIFIMCNEIKHCRIV